MKSSHYKTNETRTPPQNSFQDFRKLDYNIEAKLSMRIFFLLISK